MDQLQPVCGRGKVSITAARHAASTFATDPVMTHEARQEAISFLETVNSGRRLDAATVDMIKAEFSLKAVDTDQMLKVPGEVVTRNLPEAVKAATELHDNQANDDWQSSEVHKTTLAGQSVFIVHHVGLGAEDDAEKIQVFSADGGRLATGSDLDPMGGFTWDP
jgi:hypothetical protein